MKYEDLTPISYDEAARLVGRTKNGLYNATTKGILTSMGRGPNKAGKLAKQQVELFTDKELSLQQLSHDEAIIWHDVTRAIAARKTGKSKATAYAATSTALQEIDIDIAEDTLDRVADLALLFVKEMLDALSKGVEPDNLISVLKDSPSFNRISQLLGLNLDSIPDEVLTRLNKKAESIAYRLIANLTSLMATQLGNTFPLSSFMGERTIEESSPGEPQEKTVQDVLMRG